MVAPDLAKIELEPPVAGVRSPNYEVVYARPVQNSAALTIINRGVEGTAAVAHAAAVVWAHAPTSADFGEIPPVLIAGTDPATTPLTVSGAAAQVAALLKVLTQNGVGVTLDAAGAVTINPDSTLLAAAPADPMLTVFITDAGHRGIIVQGATGQTANMVEAEPTGYVGHLPAVVVDANGRLLLQQDAHQATALRDYLSVLSASSVTQLRVTSTGKLVVGGTSAGALAALLSTAATPSNADGANGDWAIGQNGLLYAKAAGVWSRAAVKSLIQGSNVTVTDNGDGTWTIATVGGGLPAAPSVDSRLSIPASGSAIWAPEGNTESAMHLVNATSAGDAGNRADHFFSLAKWTNRIAPGSSAVGRSSLGFTPPNAVFAYWTQPFTPTGAFRIEALTACSAQTISSLTDGHGPNIGVSDNSDIQTAGVGSYVAIEANRGTLLSQRTAGTYNPVLYSNPFSITVANAQPETSNPFWMYVRLDRDAANHWTAYVSFDRNYWIQVGTVTQALSAAFLFIGGYTNDGSHYVEFVDVVS